ncbi:AN1-type zinc finger protein 2A [Contarinia nasturtii]|uniref:AN1-type zinc finger protein 2A n=1 Tax=Contarinia nasturtii TaxID=265458 RepID=UPI0012D4798A|nr:AN1-type zinc finger protein 2A [Contarinia nasturtii]
MEFPHLGRHCSEKSCNKLDFLPMSCDACLLIFCSDHFSYQKHKCTSAHKKDVQVPVCPLCSLPVPTPRGILPDISISQHIDQYCKSDKTKIFNNKCSFRGCKKKELIPVQCGQCKLNFCLRHRHTTDHECNPKSARSNLLANAAMNRQSANQSNHLQSVQGGMTEDEALAHALARSIQELDESHDRNRRNQQQTVPCGVSNANANKDKCLLS